MKYSIVGQRKEDGHRIKWLYDDFGNQFQALVPIRDWYYKKVTDANGDIKRATFPRMLTRLQLIPTTNYPKKKNDN